LTKLGLDERRVIQLLKETNFTLNETGEGQAMEINSRSRNDLTEENYMEIVQKKTSAYLTLPMIGGAIISKASSEIIDSIRRYGSFVGPAFQIRDDVIDLTEGKGRGEIGCDIREGKRSFLAVHIGSVCSSEEKRLLFDILNKPRKQKTEVDIGLVVRLFDRYNVVDYAEEKIEKLVDCGKKSVDILPRELKHLFYIFADFAIKRTE